MDGYLKKLALALVLISTSCSDDFMIMEQRIIDSESKVPLYFYASAEQAGVNTWRPVFTYYIYSLEEG